MNRRTCNVFFRTDTPAVAGPSGSGATQGHDETAIGQRMHRLRPLRAKLTTRNDLCSLMINPARLQDIVSVWTSRSSGSISANLVFDLDPTTWSGSATGGRLASVLNTHRIDPIDVFDDRTIVLNDAGLQQLASRVQPTGCTVVRVEGPIEQADATFIARARRAGASPLEAELRAVAAVQSRGQRSLSLTLRRDEDAADFAAEMFRHYLAAVLNEPSSNIAGPPSWQVQRLLEVSGRLLVRPIETDVYSTSVDIGVVTPASRPAGPAMMSLVYDRPSNTWHGET